MVKPATSKNNSAPTSKPNYGAPVDDEDDDFEVDGLDEIESKFLVPDGDDYKLRCTDVIKDVSKAGNKMWVFTFAIVAPREQGKEFKVWVALTPAALWKAALTLGALGIHQEGAARAKFKRADVIGKEVMGTFSSSMYEGRLSSKIDAIRSLE